MTRPPSRHDSTPAAPGSLTTPRERRWLITERRWLITVGTPFPQADTVFSTMVTGSLRDAQVVAEGLAGDNIVWVRDVMLGAVFNRLVGGAWREGAEL